MSIKEQIIDIILKVAMAHHDDISVDDVTAAENAADDVISLILEKMCTSLLEM